MEWYEKLTQRRKAKGLTQKAAAQKVGLSQQGYGNYESGRSSPSLDMLVCMARAFDFDLDWLVDPNPALTLERHRQIQEAIRRLGPEAAYARLAKLPEPTSPPQEPEPRVAQPLATWTHPPGTTVLSAPAPPPARKKRQPK